MDSISDEATGTGEIRHTGIFQDETQFLRISWRKLRLNLLSSNHIGVSDTPGSSSLLRQSYLVRELHNPAITSELVSESLCE